MGAKSKTLALLLAVFLCPVAWLYTYREDGRKFWAWIGIQVVAVALESATPSGGLLMGIPALAFWVWTILGIAKRPSTWYEHYNLDRSPTLTPTMAFASLPVARPIGGGAFCVRCGSSVGGDWAYCNRCGAETPATAAPVADHNATLSSVASLVVEQGSDSAASEPSNEPPTAPVQVKSQRINDLMLQACADAAARSPRPPFPGTATASGDEPPSGLHLAINNRAAQHGTGCDRQHTPRQVCNSRAPLTG